jgi:hypothetical protein
MRWATMFGMGAALLGAGVTLGACGGYSNLGDLPGNGGEGARDEGSGGSTTTGGKGGNGMGNTGNAPSATGGNGMGNTGNAPSATGGNGMGNTGNMGTGNTGNTGAGGATCMVPSDCPQPPPVCTMCEDGSSPCVEATCDAGICGIDMPACPAPHPQCESTNDCITIDACLPCGDGCARAACLDGTCQMVCPLGGMCSTSMDCGSDLPPDFCTGGPWLCADGTCSREYQECGPI